MIIYQQIIILICVIVPPAYMLSPAFYLYYLWVTHQNFDLEKCMQWHIFDPDSVPKLVAVSAGGTFLAFCFGLFLAAIFSQFPIVTLSVLAILLISLLVKFYFKYRDVIHESLPKD